LENILFVAVSPKMADMATRIIKEMKLNIPVIIGSEIDSEKVIKSYPDVKIFISRGRTANTLQKLSGKTTVEIKCSIHDILDSIEKLIEKGAYKIAIMVSPQLIGEITYNYKLGNVTILTRPCQSDELEELLHNFHQLGVDGVICAAHAVKLAAKHGMKTELIDTEASSIKIAINESLKILQAQEKERLQEQRKTEEIKQYSEELYSAIEKAAAAVEKLSASSQELAGRSKETSLIARNTFEEVKNTTAILQIIKRVAKQTNLLGLNAAIEASRAGEYGRGFSVVATEVRKLAYESNLSAKNIDEMLNKFCNSVENVLNNVEQSNAIAQEQSKANQNIALMLDSLKEIGEKMINMADRKN